jgi:hypothetical protein
LEIEDWRKKKEQEAGKQGSGGAEGRLAGE